MERDVPTWEQSADDIAAVLDAVGSERAAIVGDVDAGPIAILFAATRPERVRALVLSNSSARILWAEPLLGVGKMQGGRHAIMPAQVMHAPVCFRRVGRCGRALKWAV